MRRAVLAVGLVALSAFLAAVLFAGSPDRLPAGTTVAGFDVGGLEIAGATEALERRFDRLQRTPVQFVAGGRTFSYTASQLGVRQDWQRGRPERGRGGRTGSLRSAA